MERLLRDAGVTGSTSGAELITVLSVVGFDPLRSSTDQRSIMDPDVTLVRIRKAQDELTHQEDIGANYDMHTVIELSITVNSLIGWLAKGGFAPDWTKYSA